METTIDVGVLLTVPVETIRELIQNAEARGQSVGPFYKLLDTTALMLETTVTLHKAAGKVQVDHIPLSFEETLQRAQDLRNLLRR